MLASITGNTCWAISWSLAYRCSATVAIPYRAILPRGIDNLLISAKAISQTHNALQFMRMSFDIMTLGFVTGQIAAAIAEQRVSTRDVDLSSLRSELQDWRIVPPPGIMESTAKMGNTLAPYMDALRSGRPNSLLVMMTQPAQAAEGVLQQAYGSASTKSEQLRLAKALAWFGNPIGNGLILNEMRALFQEEQAAGQLPREYYREDKNSPYWAINQDIASLALSGDSAVLPHILTLAESLTLGHPPVKQSTRYNQGRIDLRLVPFYNRIIVMCFAIERMPHASCIGALNRFLDDPFISEQVSRIPSEAGDKVYGGILESRLAATLARCGAKRGFVVLSEDLDDVHSMLAHYARCELTSMLQQDFGYDRRQWRKHLDRLTYPVAPIPCHRVVSEW